nr:putative F-box protein At3g52320 [Ipomoea batatas]
MSAPKKTAGVSTLPQEILMEILYKLPAKSLVRFRPSGDVAVCNVSTRQHEVSSLAYVLFLKSALLEVGGRLAIVLVHVLDLLRGGEGLCYMDVWTWEKYKKCWEKITITIPLEWSRIIYNAQWMRFATNHDGKIVLFFIYIEKFFILVCNLKSEAWRKFDVSGVEDFPIVNS